MADKSQKETRLIRNSTAEFLIFTSQDGDNSVEARYEDGTVWLSQNSLQSFLKWM